MKILNKIILAVSILVGYSCGPSLHTPRNAELVVTYEGKEVHRAGTRYASMDQLTRFLESNTKKHIIFSASWCQPCGSMLKALEQSGHIQHSEVLILNLEENWVADLFTTAGLRTVPSMLVADTNSKPESIVVGASKIVMYLVINVSEFE